MDIGELRARVVIDRSQIAPGMADVRRKVQAATRDLGMDADRGGRDVGQKLGEGLAAGVESKRGRARTAGQQVGDEVEKGLHGSQSRLLRYADRLGGMVGKAVSGGAKGGMFGLRSAVDVGGRILARGSGDLAKYAAGGVLAFAAVSGAAAAVGTSVASSNEQAIISFSTMLRKGTDTAEQAHDRAVSFIGDLQQLAATTPFEFSDLQSYASKLVSAGIDARDIIPIMKNLGDVTSGVGTGAEGIDRATVALQQMIAAQKISGEDLNQLRDAGIPVYDLLAGATGKSKGEIVKLAQAGKLGKDELDKLLDTLKSDAPKGLERFSGLMSKQSASLKGQLSNLSDTVQQGLGRVVTRAMPQIKAGVKTVSDAAAGAFAYLDEHGDDIARIFTAGGRAVESFGSVVKPVFRSFFGEISGGQDTLDTLADWLDTHQEDILDWALAGAGGALKLGRALATGASIGLKAYAALADGVGNSLDFILRTLQKVIDTQAIAADALGMKGTADKLRGASAGVQGLIDKNDKNDAGAAMAREMAEALDNKLIPSLDRAQGALDDYGSKAKDAARRGDEWRGTLQKVSQSVDENGRSLSDHSKKGRANRQTIIDATKALNKDAQAAYDNEVAKGNLKGAEKAAAKVIRDGTRDIKDQASKAKLNKDKVDDLIDSVKRIPKSRSTAIDFTTNASSVLVKLRAKWGKAQGETKGNQADAAFDAKTGGRAYGGLTELAVGRHGGGMAGGMVPGNTPLSRGDDYLWQMRDGRKQPLRGGEGVYMTEVMRDPYERRRMDAMNLAARSGQDPRLTRSKLGEHGGMLMDGKAKGGMIGGSAVPASTLDVGPSAAAFAQRTAQATAAAYAAATKKTLQEALDASRAAAASASAGMIDVNNPHGLTTWGGGRFTNLFAANLARAQKMAGTGIPVIQGGFRPKTSYSGTSHQGDAIDTRVNYAVLRALRAVGIATGDRTGLGNWGPHMHGVPLRGAGYGAGAAIGQAQDYLRRGGASQSPRSPWGLAGGGMVDRLRGYADGTAAAPRGFAWTSEKAAELVVNPQVRSYSGGERVLNGQQTAAALSGSRAPLIGTVNIAADDGRTRTGMADLRFQTQLLEQGRAGR